MATVFSGSLLRTGIFRASGGWVLVSALFILLLAAVPSDLIAQTDPATVGQWSAVQSWPFLAAHSHLLPSGKVLFWPTFAQGDNPNIWDPATSSFTAINHAGFNIFCSGHSYLADGRLFVAGGHNGASGYGLPFATIFNPSNNTWNEVADMNAGRWYPTSTTLANGDVLVVAGEIDPTTGNDALPQVFQVDKGTWRDLSTAQLLLPYYPRLFVAPNGKVFSAGTDQTSRYLDTSGTGSWSVVANRTFGSRDYGSAVMYDAGKILTMGGGDPPTATAEIIDLNAGSPAWSAVASMHYARRQLNATLLPDGTVLVTGGSSGSGFDNSSAPVYAAELWDPATKTWTVMASASVYRGYHSTSLLLPDGRVLSAGGNITPSTNAQVYSPPYLFKTARPTISSAPPTITYGQAFSVGTPDAANISKVSLIRIASVTHAFDENQRIIFPQFTQGSGTISVTAPANGNLAPPGDYLLFILANGVPSVGSFVRLGSTPAPPGPVTISPTSLFLGNIVVGNTSAAQTLTITNGQSTPLTISGISISPTTDFIQTNTCIPSGSTSGTVAAGASCTISVTMKPASVGNKVATLSVTDDASTSPQTASLTGAGITAIGFSPTSLAFGNVAVNTSSPAKSVRLQNSLSVPMTITGISASPTVYTQTNNCIPSGSTTGTLQPAATCTVNVTLTPTTTGSVINGTLTVTETPNFGPQTLAMAGAGIAPVTLSPTSLSFSTQTVGTTSAAKSIKLTNWQTATLHISNVSVTGDFIQTNTCIPAGSTTGSVGYRGTCTINVTFKPTATGTRTGTLTVTDDAANSPQTVTLTGTGG